MMCSNMKFFTKIALALLAATTFSMAEINVGGHIGGSYNMLWDVDTYMEDYSGLGFNAGVEAKIALPIIAVVPGVYFAYESVGKTDYGVDYTLSKTGIEVPVMARLSLLPIVFVEAGPQLNINMSTTIEFGDEEFDDSNASTAEFGIAVGAGADLPVLPLTVDVRFFMGLSSMSDDDEFTGKRMGIDLGVTYWFL